MTNLANYVQPVIRYQLGDSVVISDQWVRLRITTDDHLGGGTHRRDPAASTCGDGEAVLLPMAIATVVEETRGVRRYPGVADRAGCPHRPSRS